MVPLGTIFLLIAGITLSPVSVEADLEQNNLPSELTVVKQARDLIAQYGNEVWPEFGDNLAPVLLRSGEKDYLLDHPEPPAGFKQLKGEPNLHVKKGHLLPRPAATAYPIGGAWSVVIPARKELIEWVKNELGNSNFQLSKAGYLQALIHESFHAYQMGSLGGRDDVPTFGFSGSSVDLQQQLRDGEWWETRANEIGDLLVRGLKADDLNGVRKLTNRALNLTEDGSKKLNSSVRSFEHQIQWLEGSARYTGTRIMMEAFGGFLDTEEGVEFQPPSRVRSKLLNQLTSELSGPTPVRDKLAAMGATKAMILDRLYFGWKDDFFSNVRSFDKILKTGTSVPEPLKDFPITNVKLNEMPLTVGLANTPGRKSHGLQHVAKIEPLDGMVFPFNEETNSAFWMKDTEISLQIGFFNTNGKLIDSVVMDPCHSDDCPSYAPDQQFKYVLELPADSDIQLNDLSRQPGQLVLSTSE